MTWLGIESITLSYWDEAPTNWTTWPGCFYFVFHWLIPNACNSSVDVEVTNRYLLNEWMLCSLDSQPSQHWPSIPSGYCSLFDLIVNVCPSPHHSPIPAYFILLGLLMMAMKALSYSPVIILLCSFYISPREWPPNTFLHLFVNIWQHKTSSWWGKGVKQCLCKMCVEKVCFLLRTEELRCCFKKNNPIINDYSRHQ